MLPDRFDTPRLILRPIGRRVRYGRLLGAFALRRPEPYRLDCGYVLARPFWGRGLMTEVLTAAAQWAMRQDGIWRIGAVCDVENRASARVMEKAGLQQEGIMRRWIIHPNVSSEPRDLLQLRHGPIGGGMRIRCLALVFSLSVMLTSAVARAEQQWLTLPPTPTLTKAEQSGYAPINGIKIWYATFGKSEPVLLLHGGLANSNYWGNQVPALARNYRVIVMDSRGHGRSTHDDRPYGYDLMASDVIGLMDFLKLPKAAIVGWSDGAIIGLDIAIHHPERLTKLFAFAANSDPSGVADIAQSPVFNAYIARTEKEYAVLSPTPDQYKSFLDQIGKMWETQPNFTAEQLRGITVPTWIVDADHDEAIKRENTEFMAGAIPNAGLLLQPQVSHFSFLQDPQQFTGDVLHFMEHVKAQ